MMSLVELPSARVLLACVGLFSTLSLACRDETSHVITPAPQPAKTAPAVLPESAELPRGLEEPSPSTKRKLPERHRQPTELAPSSPPRSPAARVPEHAAKEAPTPAPAKSTTPTPAPAAPAPASHTRVPSTAHVHVDIPAGMQTLLDADSRMQPWVDDVMRIADRCYASELEKSASTAGAIVVDVTMHKDDRPDLDMKSLPPQLAGLVACATGDLMRNRMPLFTGPEGQRHTLAVRFSP